MIKSYTCNNVGEIAKKFVGKKFICADGEKGQKQFKLVQMIQGKTMHQNINIDRAKLLTEKSGPWKQIGKIACNDAVCIPLLPK